MTVYSFEMPLPHYPTVKWVAADSRNIAERLVRLHEKFDGEFTRVFELTWVSIGERSSLISYRQRAVCPDFWAEEKRARIL